MPKPLFKKQVSVVISLALLLIFTISSLWFFLWRFNESTDDAYVDADIVVISSKVTGYVSKIHISDNQEVTAQSPLIEIDPVDFQAKVDEAQASIQHGESEELVLGKKILEQHASIQQADASVSAAEASILPARKMFERSQALQKKSYATQERFERDQAEFLKAEAQLKQAQATLESAQRSLAVLEASADILKARQAQNQARLAQALQLLKDTKIIAPCSGFVGNKAVQAGQLVRPGQLLMVIVTQKPYIRANFKETQITNMKAGQPVEIKVDAYPGRTFKGRIESLSPASGAVFSLLPPENATGNFTKVVQRIPVKITLEDPKIKTSLLRPGLSVIAKVSTKEG